MYDKGIEYEERLQELDPMKHKERIDKLELLASECFSNAGSQVRQGIPKRHCCTTDVYKVRIVLNRFYQELYCYFLRFTRQQITPRPNGDQLFV